LVDQKFFESSFRKLVWSKKFYFVFVRPMSLQQIAHIDEILDRIFVHLDTPTLVHRIQLVCKQWNTVAEEHIDYTYNDNWPIRRASLHGYLAAVDKLLAWTPANAQNIRVDPSACNNYAIRRASACGNLAVVNRLLQDPRVDPSAEYNEAIRAASRGGHLIVVNRLL
jgi:hypothetical protein